MEILPRLPLGKAYFIILVNETVDFLSFSPDILVEIILVDKLGIIVPSPCLQSLNLDVYSIIAFIIDWF
jgi:hypothetical protein